ncbi:MAG: GNAT family N-acetyltransferase [Acidimicrobiales bacterium]
MSAAGVEVRLLDEPSELAAAAAVFETIWGCPEATANLLKALSFAGHYVSGAWAEGEMVGGAFGFLSAPWPSRLHSHVAGVAARHQGRGIGFAIKQHQRAWAIARGIPEITWTFDPLVRRNAWFNLEKLGATAGAYYPDFYGRLTDALNDGDETDRCLVRWDLTPPAPATNRAAGSAAVILRVGAGDRPVVQQKPPAGEARSPLRCQVPDDIGAIRRRDPTLAREWRLALRHTLGEVIASGYVATGFDRHAGYLLEPVPQ